MEIDVKRACALLKEHDDILILTHRNPDGDAYGASFALLWALEAMGKRARVETPDGYLKLYSFVFGDYNPAEFEPRFVVSADIAGPDMMGNMCEQWGTRIDLCIDHHRTNNIEAGYKLVCPQEPATCMIVCQIIRELGIPVSARIATAIFTGISTDTGCFRHMNVTAGAHRVAAEMIDAGAEHILCNKIIFDTMSRGRLEIDRIIRDTLEYHFDGRCAIIVIPLPDVERLGISDGELDGISSFTRRIEGVQAGVTLRETKNGGYRVSLRTCAELDAAAICARLGGGGHKNAAGCTVRGSLAEVKKAILDQIAKDISQPEDICL